MLLTPALKQGREEKASRGDSEKEIHLWLLMVVVRQEGTVMEMEMATVAVVGAISLTVMAGRLRPVSILALEVLDQPRLALWPRFPPSASLGKEGRSEVSTLLLVKFAENGKLQLFPMWAPPAGRVRVVDLRVVHNRPPPTFVDGEEGSLKLCAHAPGHSILKRFPPLLHLCR
jgi:hypothetical protein